MTLDGCCEREASPLKTSCDWLKKYRTIPSEVVGAAIHKFTLIEAALPIEQECL